MSLQISSCPGRSRVTAYRSFLLLAFLFITFFKPHAQTTIVGWDGPVIVNNYIDIINQDFRDPLANTGIPGNVNATIIYTFGGVSSALASDAYGDGNMMIFNKNPGTGWADGAGTKGWVFSFSTAGYNTLQFSGKMAASTSFSSFMGPRDFKLQYSLDNNSWTDVTGGTIAAGAATGASYTLNAVNNVVLPAVLNNKPLVYLRMIMTSNLSPTGATVTASGMSYVDDFKVTGLALALPVTFESVAASVQNGRIRIHWTTLTENNNDHFDVQASANGEQFSTITTVKTKATGGNSTAKIEYTVEWSSGNSGFFFGLPALLLALGAAFRKRRHLCRSAFLALMIITGFGNCNKKAALSPGNDTPRFIRIVQVDRDGTEQPSKVIQVIPN